MAEKLMRKWLKLGQTWPIFDSGLLTNELVYLWCGNWFVTVIFRHRKWVRAGLTRPRALSWRFKTVTVYVNPWWFSTNRHACQSMMLNPWWFLKPSQMLFTDGFSVIRDENFPSWINRILVVYIRAEGRVLFLFLFLATGQIDSYSCPRSQRLSPLVPAILTLSHAVCPHACNHPLRLPAKDACCVRVSALSSTWSTCTFGEFFYNYLSSSLYALLHDI